MVAGLSGGWKVAEGIYHGQVWCERGIACVVSTKLRTGSSLSVSGLFAAAIFLRKARFLSFSFLCFGSLSSCSCLLVHASHYQSPRRCDDDDDDDDDDDGVLGTENCPRSERISNMYMYLLTHTLAHMLCLAFGDRVYRRGMQET